MKIVVNMSRTSGLLLEQYVAKWTIEHVDDLVVNTCSSFISSNWNSRPPRCLWWLCYGIIVITVARGLNMADW